MVYLDKLFATKPRDEWIKLLYDNDAGFVYSPINEINDLQDDIQIKENNYFVDFNHPIAGPIKYISTPVQFSQTPAQVKSGAPEYAQNTEEVLLEIGYSWEDIAKFQEEEVV